MTNERRAYLERKAEEWRREGDNRSYHDPGAVYRINALEAAMIVEELLKEIKTETGVSK